MENSTSEITAKQFMDQLGRDRVREKLFGKGPEGEKPGARNISQHVWLGSFPASWYAVIEELCEEDGVSCPKNLFAFRQPASEAKAATGAGK